VHAAHQARPALTVHGAHGARGAWQADGVPATLSDRFRSGPCTSQRPFREGQSCARQAPARARPQGRPRAAPPGCRQEGVSGRNACLVQPGKRVGPLHARRRNARRPGGQHRLVHACVPQRSGPVGRGRRGARRAPRRHTATAQHHRHTPATPSPAPRSEAAEAARRAVASAAPHRLCVEFKWSVRARLKRRDSVDARTVTRRL
jgi:hypothetical protein